MSRLTAIDKAFHTFARFLNLVTWMVQNQAKSEMGPQVEEEETS